MPFGAHPGMLIAELFWVALVVAFWVAIIALIVVAVRWLIRQERRSTDGESLPRAEDPLEILRRRYAAGDIDDEEFQRRRKTLTG
jgi:putative membrane protein